MNLSFAGQNFDRFLADLGSDKPTPGGGPAAAFTAAMGSALAEMVASINAKRKKNTEVNWKSVLNAERLKSLKTHLAHLADEDAKAYAKLTRVWKSPDADAKQEALREAAETPLHIMRTAWIAIRLCESEAPRTASVLWSDLLEAAVLLCAGMDSARLNVLANTRYLTDAKLREKIETQAQFWLVSAKPMETRLRRQFDALIVGTAAA